MYYCERMGARINIGRIIAILLCTIGGFCLAKTTNAQATVKTPLTDGFPHEGVLGCYGSTCHSRQEATGITVRQNEILTWLDSTSVSGAHSRSYKTLKSPRSKAIAKRLGIGPANKARECLSCHTDNIPEKRRLRTFQLDDGVSCESCHGGSGEWTKQHYNKNISHSMNLSAGLYPLEDPEVRANICLSCHLGSEEEGQFVNHRLMAAGHPRLSFELDLFTELQSHHTQDYDYRRRKKVRTGAQIWAVGQSMTLKRQLKLFNNRHLNRDGIFPELVFFDCLACHRKISDDPDWRPKARQNPDRINAPGLVNFNDASMIMLLATAKAIAPDLAPKFEDAVKAFHVSINQKPSNRQIATQRLRNLTNELMHRIEKTNFTKTQTLEILDTIVAGTLTHRYTDYVAAEQAIMAIDTLLSSMIASKQVAEESVRDMRREINDAYDAVENPNDYDQDKLTRILLVLSGRIKRLR